MPPYKTLGTHLKYLRERQDETVAEVSGAVEIDEEELQRIEQGIERPSEDILMLLINHFDMHDGEAVHMWELAGYDHRATTDTTLNLEDVAAGKPIMMLLAMETRTHYSDGIEVVANKAGATLTFTQAGGKGPQPIARVGMSLEQAETVVTALQQALFNARYGWPKQLPPPESKSK